MNKCFVSKIKSELQGKDLPIYESIKICLSKDSVPNTAFLKIRTNADIIAISGSFDVLDSSFNVVQSNTTLFTGNINVLSYIRPYSTNTTIVIKNKYTKTLRLLGGRENATSQNAYRIPINVGDFEYSKLGVSDNLAFIYFPNREFYLYGTLDFGTIDTSYVSVLRFETDNEDDLKFIVPPSYRFGSELTQFQVFGRYFRKKTDFHADLSCFENCANLETLNLLNCSHVTGSLDALLDSLHSNGKVSGTLRVNIGGTKCTYSGSISFQDMTFAFTSSGWSQVTT